MPKIALIGSGFSELSAAANLPAEASKVHICKENETGGVPNLDVSDFNENEKKQIENDFKIA